MPGYSVELWWGVYGPGGMAPDLVDALNKEIGGIIGEKEMRDRFAQEGAEASPISPSDFATVTANDLAMWRGIARERNIKPE